MNDTAKIEKIEIEKDTHRINIKQNTPEWIELRKQHITATDAPRLITMFIDKKKYYGISDTEFYNYKHDINQKPRDSFSLENMAKGNMIEDIAEEYVKIICEDLAKTSDDNSVFTYERGIVITRSCWMMSSYDYMIYKNGKILFPIEVKHTDSENTFKQFSDINHYNYYQLAFQMLTCKAKYGTLLFYKNSDPETVQHRSIDKSSPYCKDIIKHADTFKKIWTDVCKNKVNPCRDKMKVSEDLAKEISRIDKSFECNESTRKEVEEKQKKLDDSKPKRRKQIDGLRQRIEERQKQIEERQKQIEEDKKQIEEDKKQIDYLEQEESNSQAEISDLQASISNEEFLNEKKEEAKAKLLKHMKDNDIYNFVSDDKKYIRVTSDGKKDHLRTMQNVSN